MMVREGSLFTRSDFLTILGSAPLAHTLPATLPPASSARSGAPSAPEGLDTPGDYALEVILSDGFRFWIVLTNVRPVKPGERGFFDYDTVFTTFQWRLVRVVEGTDAFIAFVFPPQPLREQSFRAKGISANWSAPMQKTPTWPPVNYASAQMTQMAFQAPDSFTRAHYFGIPFTLNAIFETCYGGFWQFSRTHSRVRW